MCIYFGQNEMQCSILANRKFRYKLRLLTCAHESTTHLCIFSYVETHKNKHVKLFKWCFWVTKAKL